MVSKAAERSSNVSAVTLPASIDARISLCILNRAVSVEWNFLYADWYWLDVFELFICDSVNCKWTACELYVNIWTVWRSENEKVLEVWYQTKVCISIYNNFDSEYIAVERHN